MPSMKTPIANTQSAVATTQISMPSAHHAEAPTIAQRSPQRAVTNDAGMLERSEPIPISVTISAASATEPPSWRTVSAITGRIAPSPSANSSVGPNAARAISRRRKAGSFTNEARAGCLFFAEQLSRSARAAPSSSVAAATLSSRGQATCQRSFSRRSWMAILTNRAADTRDRGIDTALLILRVVLGILVLLHGISKLPPPPKEIAAMRAQATLPAVLAWGVYLVEIVAPILLIIGVWTRLAAVLIAINMVVAVLTAHNRQILRLRTEGGYALELQAMYLFVAVALAFTGAGRLSVG